MRCMTRYTRLYSKNKTSFNSSFITSICYSLFFPLFNFSTRTAFILMTDRVFFMLGMEKPSCCLSGCSSQGASSPRYFFVTFTLRYIVYHVNRTRALPQSYISIFIIYCYLLVFVYF